MKRPALILILFMLAPAVIATAGRVHRDSGTVHVGAYSQEEHPHRARIGAHIEASASRAGEAHLQSDAPGVMQAAVVTIRSRAGGSSNLPPSFPSLSASSAILRVAHPHGPGSFWYSDTGGHACEYVPGTVTPCFTLVGPGATAGGPSVSPAAVAQSLVRRVELAPGAIKTSPTSEGLTGAQSWFWLFPAPRRQSLAISLAGETVSVTADPMVVWRFGDGASLDGGPGVPYESDAGPSGAVTHVYDTRCLPGDQGHDPYVLASCGQDGYSVEALVVWRISYSAAGPVAGDGALPVRTTETSISYPVSESRAFLVSRVSR